VEGANYGVKRETREREREKRGMYEKGGGREAYAFDRKTDGREMANVTAERSLRDVKCREATIDIECRRRDVGTRRDISKFSNRTPAVATRCCVNDI